jgi:hypothetical protein
MRKKDIQKVINKIKQCKEEWKIEKILTFDGHYGSEEYKEWSEMLINNFAKLEYRQETVTAATGKHLNVISGKMYFKNDFTSDEWKEVEQVLNNQSQNPQQDEKKKEENSKNNYYQNWTREQLINEIERLKVELEKVESTVVSEHSQTSQQLKSQLQKVQSVLVSFQTPNPSHASPQNNSVLPIAVGAVGLASLLAGLIIWKRNKNW